MSAETRPPGASLPASPTPPAGASSSQPIVIRQEAPPPRRSWRTRLLWIALGISLVVNLSFYAQYQEYFSTGGTILERYHSGAKEAGASKLAVIRISGTIMPPFTKRLLDMIDKASQDERVKGVVLVVDSPGGLVADSHQIYHRLASLREQKPIVVSMSRMAASGGYYVAMGAGPQAKIFAEPTTWTGSIGVMIPRYDVRGLAEKVGFASEPFVTGEFKDALSPFREMTDAEKQIWTAILDDAFARFLEVIAANRAELKLEDVRKLATGQIYTATQALQHRLIDAIGYEEDAIESLKAQLQLDLVRVVDYESQPGLLDLLMGDVQARQEQHSWRALLEASVPQALYYCSWGLGVPGW